MLRIFCIVFPSNFVGGFKLRAVDVHCLAGNMLGAATRLCKMCQDECIVVCEHGIGSFTDHAGYMTLGITVIDESDLMTVTIFTSSFSIMLISCAVEHLSLVEMICLSSKALMVSAWMVMDWNQCVLILAFVWI